MAFSKSLPKGQIPVGCQLCEGGHKIEWKCTDCNLLMCDRCKDRVHLRIAKDHSIVNIKKIAEHVDSWDSFVFSELKCQDHINQQCSLYCTTCNKVICLKCIIKVHNGHTFVDAEEFEDKKEILKEGQKKVESERNKLITEREKMMAHEKPENPKLKQIKQNILDQKNKLLKEVEQCADNLVQDVNQHFGNLEHEEKTEIDKEINIMHLKNDSLKSIITSRDFMKFFRDFDKLKFALNEDMPQETMNISAFPIFVPGEFTVKNFGTAELEGRRIREHNSPIEFKVTNTWTTELKNIHIIVRCPDGTLWIADNLMDELQHIRLEKDNHTVLSSFSINIYGLADFSSRDILVSTGEPRLKLIDSRTNEMTDSVFDVAPLLARGVHIGKDQKVIISARSPGPAFPANGRRIIIVMDQAGNRLIEYEKDSNNKRLFTVPLWISNTSNGNICVVDCLHEDDRGRVVVIGQEGNTLGIYSGHHAVNTVDRPFTPVGLLTTPSDNIVVTDMDNNLVHILTNRGDFISYFDLYNIGIQFPHGSALSTYGQLYFGCTSSLGYPETFRAKLYELEF